MFGLVVRKLDMTQLPFEGTASAVTLARIPSLRVAQIKAAATDGYDAVVLEAFDNDRVLIRREIRVPAGSLKAGDLVSGDVLKDVKTVDITAVSKGLGFTGAMKRHNFAGGPGRVGSKFHRALGSTGMRKPRRTKPGKKMHGQCGDATLTIKGVKVVAVDAAKGVVALKGPIPGGRNTWFTISF